MLGIIGVDFSKTNELQISYSAFTKYWKNGTTMGHYGLHQLIKNIKKAYVSVRGNSY
jgi:hypothetical protein